jgi:hypothetical protein
MEMIIIQEVSLHFNPIIYKCNSSNEEDIQSAYVLVYVKEDVGFFNRKILKIIYFYN